MLYPQHLRRQAHFGARLRRGTPTAGEVPRMALAFPGAAPEMHAAAADVLALSNDEIALAVGFVERKADADVAIRRLAKLPGT